MKARVRFEGMEQITFAPTFTAWQNAARRALAHDLEPAAIHWHELADPQPTLGMFDEADDRPAARPTAFRVPRAFVEIARRVACHRSPHRWPLLYHALWRLTHGEPHLLEVTVDPDICTLAEMDKAIRRDVHKMRAFVRFREVVAEDGAAWFVAWFEPGHHIVELNAPFFTDRFASMRWSILTPDRCAHWDGKTLHFTAGLTRAEAPDADSIEPLWREYYANIFNPARVKIHAMQAEMPKRYWKNLPEAQLIPALIREAPARVETMIARSQSQHPPATDWHPAQPPDTRSLDTLRNAAAACTACPLMLLKPRVLVALGATAANALVGPKTRVLRDRGKVIATEFCEQTVITVHPSSLLRAPDEAAGAEAYELFLRDLRTIAALIGADEAG